MDHQKATVSHRLTPIQRDILRRMVASEMTTYFDIGYKTTSFKTGLGGHVIVRCSSIVLHFLEANGYVQRDGAMVAWEPTAKAVAAVGRMRARRSED